MTAPNIDGYTIVELTAGPDTQPEHMNLDGMLMALPVGTDIGSGPTSPGKIMGVYGYPDGLGGSGKLRWVMSSSLPTVAKSYIHSIPDTGWVDTESETAVRNIGRALIERGIPMADVGTVLTTVHNAAVTNERIYRDSQP
jgi:hypothetical protein